MTMAARQQWLEDNGLTTMAQQQWQPNNNGLTMMAQQQWSIACDNASVTGGMPQQHEAIATRAREGASVAGGRRECTRQYLIPSKPVRM
jgi:hypothetical protein